MKIKSTYLKFNNFLQKIVTYSSPRWVVLLIDIFLVINSFILSYLIRFNFEFKFGSHDIHYQIPLIAFLAFISFLITGSYKGIIRHTGIKDAENVSIATFIMTFFSLLIVFISRKIPGYDRFNIPLSVVGFNFFVSTFLLIGSRVFYKSIYYYLIFNSKHSKNALIYGANSGATTYDILISDRDNSYNIIGFVDDRKQFIHKKIHRKNVYSLDEIDSEFVKYNKIEEIIISKPEASPLELLDLANKFIDIGLKVKTVPHIDKWTQGAFKTNEIKDVNIEELLNRIPIKIDNPKIKKELKNKTVLITGAAGSIGSELANQIAQYNPEKLILLDQSESPLYDLQQDFIRKKFIGDFKFIVADITDRYKIEEYFDKYRPDMVFHAAAYKHVPLMEENPYEAVKVNVLGSINIMKLAVKYKAEKFVMVSTDKAVNPTNVMGATKRAAEIYASCIQKKYLETSFITTRFGNVLGSNGSVIPLFKKQIQSGGPLTVTHKEIKRFFMTIPEACQLVLEAGCMGNGGEIFVFDMGEPVKIYDLAIKMIHLSGKSFPDEIDIKITGLRPGEKLFEETLGKEESDLPTYHEKIKIANIPNPECKKVDELINKFSLIHQMNPIEIVSLLKELIPEYKSNNSIYEKLDMKQNYN